MTPRALCTPGQAESLKLGVHGAFAVLAGLCFAYNVAALLYRKERHLAVNSCLYGTLTAIEVYQVKHHLRRAC